MPLSARPGRNDSNAVSVQTFYYWKRQLAQHDGPGDTTAPRLLPVRLLAHAAPIELVLPGGATLRLAPGCDLAFVRSLLSALAVPPC